MHITYRIKRHHHQPNGIQLQGLLAFILLTLLLTTTQAATKVREGIPPAMDAWIAIALENNPGLLAMRQDWEAARSRVAVQSSLPDPMLILESERGRESGEPMAYRLGITQGFPWFGTLGLRGNQASLEAAIKGVDVEALRRELVRQIKEVYFDMIFLREEIRILEENLQLLKQLEAVVQRRVQGGASQQDLIRLQVEIGKMENVAITLKRRMPALQSRAAALLNLENPDGIPWPEFTSWSLGDLDKEHLESRMLDENPILGRVRHQAEVENQGLRLAQKSGWPDFQTGFTYVDNREGGNSGMPGGGEDAIMISLGVRLPLWRSRVRAEVQAARAMQQSAVETLRNTSNRMRSELQDLLVRQDDAHRQIQLYRDTLLPKARQAMEITRTAYRSGEASIMDVIDSQRTLLEFERMYFDSLTRHEQLLAGIELLCGGLEG